jgi:Fic family protein
VSHWVFEHIHPVADGNGRIGRLLVPLMLRQKGATDAACAFFGEAVHEEKALYVEALRAAPVTGDNPESRLSCIGGWGGLGF